MTSLFAARPRPSVIPGFGLTLGLTLLWLGLIVLVPLAGLFITAAGLGPAKFMASITSPRVLAALRLSFGLSILAASINLVMGFVIAWVMTRYEFPGRRLTDALIDIPFALPTAVAGIALTAIYAENGPVGAVLADLGIKVAYTPLGILIAMIFIGLPFVTRTIEPVLKDLDPSLEEAAHCLGADRLQSFLRVVLPGLAPAALTGFALAFARAAGEYGSIIFIAGNLPMKSEIVPLLIVIKLEEFSYGEAAAIAVSMLTISFLVLLVINRLQGLSR